jgi:hypothetical protein
VLGPAIVMAVCFLIGIVAIDVVVSHGDLSRLTLRSGGDNHVTCRSVHFSGDFPHRREYTCRPDRSGEAMVRREDDGGASSMRILPFRSSATVSIEVQAVLSTRLVSVRFLERATGNIYDVVAEAPLGADPQKWFNAQSFQQKLRWLDESLAIGRRSLSSGPSR